MEIYRVLCFEEVREIFFALGGRVKRVEVLVVKLVGHQLVLNVAQLSSVLVRAHVH